MTNPATLFHSAGAIEASTRDAVNRLRQTMRTTVKCRYNAAVRLQHQRSLSLAVALVSMLGLVLIPTLQNSGIPLAFKASFLNVVQAFFGIVALLYLTMLFAARYDSRAHQLTACADRLEILIRDLDGCHGPAGTPLRERLDDFQHRYSGIVAGVEHHNVNDYRLAFLAMGDEYAVGRLRRLRLSVQANLVRAATYALPVALLVAECVFLTDMVGVTRVTISYLTGVAPLTLLHISA